MELVFLTFSIFALGMIGMSIGVIIANRSLQGSCGGAAALDQDGVTACGACGKKEAEMCPSDDQLVRIAQIAHPNPSHHH